MSRNGSPSRLSRFGPLAAGFGIAAVVAFVAVGTARLQGVERRMLAVVAERDSLSGATRTLRDSLKALGNELDASRCALGAAAGINAYHEGDFALAVELYDGALACDPTDANVLHLKAYSLFKSDELEAAIETQRDGVALAPDDAWGYFNLVKYLCAAEEPDAAAEEMARAISLAPEMAETASRDREFQSLCRGRIGP